VLKPVPPVSEAVAPAASSQPVVTAAAPLQLPLGGVETPSAKRPAKGKPDDSQLRTATRIKK
jgi:hypothetical protein